MKRKTDPEVVIAAAVAVHKAIVIDVATVQANRLEEEVLEEEPRAEKVARLNLADMLSVPDEGEHTLCMTVYIVKPAHTAAITSV